METRDYDVPYVVYEGTIARFERTVKRLIVAVIVAVILLFASNAAWLYVWNQYDFITEDIQITNDQSNGSANYMGAGASGVINNGKHPGETEDGD